LVLKLPHKNVRRNIWLIASINQPASSLFKAQNERHPSWRVSLQIPSAIRHDQVPNSRAAVSGEMWRG
jgi:hypothetical protein